MAYQNLARRLKFLIASLRRHGAGHVIEVFRQESIRRRYARTLAPLPDAATLMRSFAWFRSEDSFHDDFRRSVAGRLPLTRANRKEFFTGLLLSLESYDEILTDAELIGEGRFPALGICISEPGGRFDWHRDYASGRSWPRVHFSAIRFVADDGSDVKYVWELSRMYWIAWLGKAYWVSNNGAWSRDFTRLIDDWRGSNPIDTGVNWTMPMEVAIRGFWLVMGYGLFHGAPNITDDWWTEYLRLAWGHGRYLENNLEYFSNLTNHYISNCFGLVALGTFFAGSADGDRWLREGRRRMIEEIGHQVLADGVHYERSIGYHRLVLEMYLIALVLLERAGLPFPPESRAAIERMGEFMRDYTPPAGTAPQLGDSDDGVILRLRADQELYDHRDTMAMAAAVFQRADFMRAAGGFSLPALIMLGSEGFERTRGLAGTPSAPSRLYREGGFAILRSGPFHVFADVGEIGLHGNNDTLSFTLSGPEGGIIIDPGTYCYTRDSSIRNALRSTRAHNAPMVDGVEIADFDGLWRIRRDDTNVRITGWNPAGTPEGTTILEASHGAYRRLPGGPVIVCRRWELAGGELRVHDRLTGNGNHTYTVRFTIPGTLHVRRTGERTIEITGQEGTMITMECSHELALREGWYSPGYGTALPATLVETGGHLNGGSELVYIYRLHTQP